MDRFDAACSREDSELLKQEQQFMRQIMFVADQAFADRTLETRGGDQDEEGVVRPLAWEYLFSEAAE